MQSKIYPAQENAIGLRHPIDGPLAAAGSLWTEDGFTARLITDGAVTRDATAAWTAPAGDAPAADAATPATTKAPAKG